MGLLTQPHGVMFDMDGLLLDTERLFLHSFVQTRRHFGLSDSPEIFINTIGLRYDLAKPLIAACMGAGFDYGAFEKVWMEHRVIAFQGAIPRRPGAKTLMRLLSAKGIKIGVATSTDTKTARRHLEGSGLLEHIGPIIGGDMVDRPKPDPQAYLNLASALGVDPTQCIAFEDSDVGTRAAIASGAQVIQVPDMIDPSDDVRALGHLIAPSLLEGAISAGIIPVQQGANL
jgi:HAD superfamily hydrolase (TIGR01509 family)